MKRVHILLTREASRELARLSKHLCTGPAEALEELLDMPFGLVPGRKYSNVAGGIATLYPYKDVKHVFNFVDYRYRELVERSSAAGLSKSDYCMLLIKMLGPLRIDKDLGRNYNTKTNRGRNK